jgi:putative spermidine/putrescine transport system permease protein
MSREPARLVPWLLLAPTLVLFMAVFAVPLLILFMSSFERLDTTTFAVVERFTLFNYRKFLFDEFYITVLLVTLKVSLLVTLIALIAGYPLAMYLTKASSRERSLLMLLIISPLLVSVVIRTFGWVIVLGPKGVINWALLELGLLSVPLKLMYTETAVVIGLTHIYYPFMVLAIYTALRNIDPAVIRAAQSLGAGPARTFWQITLPLSVPGVVAGSLIVFALSVSSFVTPSLLGGPWVKVAAYLAWEQNVTVLDWPFAAAISVILLLLTALIMVISNRLVERTWFAGVFQ